MAESGQTAAKPEVIIKTDEKIDIEVCSAQNGKGVFKMRR